MVHVELVTSHYIMGTCTLLSGHVIVYGLFDMVTCTANVCVSVCVFICVTGVDEDISSKHEVYQTRCFS